MLTSAATAVFLDEYTPGGTFVQSVALPIAASGSQKALTLAGSAATEGGLSLSVNGRYLVIGGYDAAPGTATVGTTTVSTVNRVVARIDANGNVDTSTSLTDAFTAGSFRGVSSTDGTKFYLSASTEGVRYVASLGATTSTIVSNTSTNNRTNGIYNNQLYLASGAGTLKGINTLTPSLPTAAGATAAIAFTNASTTQAPVGFYIVPISPAVGGVTAVAYVADQGIGTGITKFTFDGSGWTSRGSVSPTPTNLSGITALKSPTSNSISLFITGAGGLQTLTDANTAGFTGTLTGTFTNLVTSSTNMAFRGVAFAPAPPPTVTLLNPTSGMPGSSVVITGTSFYSSGVLPLSVSFNGTAATAVTLNSATQITATVPVGATTGDVTVTTQSGTSATSTSTLFAVIAPTSPLISTLSPNTTTAGGNDFILTVNGAAFIATSGVNFNGVARTTTFVSTTQLTATVLAADILTPGTYAVTVTDGVMTSNSVNFTVTGLYYAKPIGDLDLLSTFGTNTDGTGTAPTSFAIPSTVYHVGGTGRTISNAWTVTGTGSKVVLDAGASFTIPAAANFTGPLDLSATATLVQQNAASAVAFGTVDPTSTINFAQAGSFAVPQLAASGYGNLKLTGGTKTFLGSTTQVRGSLVADGVTSLTGATSAPFSTITLQGNFTLLNGTTFDPSDLGRFTLLLNSGTTQTLTGNGTDFALFRLTTATSGTAAVLATTGGSSHLVLSNTSGSGGYALATGTTLTLSGNNLTLVAGGNTFIGGGSGTLLSTAGSTLTYNHNGATALGTLRLGASERPARVVLNATGTASTLALPASVGTVVLGGLTLTAGTLDIGAGNTLQLDGPVTAGAGLLQGSATTGLSFTGTSPVTGSLGFTATAGSQFQTLTLNQVANTLIAVNSTLAISTLTLTKGSLYFTPATQATVTTLSGGNADSFVNALTLTTPAATSTTLTFPLGASVGGYRPVVLAATQVAATATAYAVRATDGNTTSRGLDNSAMGTNPPLTRTSSARYYSLNEASTSNFVSGTLTLAFGGGDGVTDLPSLRLARSANVGSPFADVNPGSTPTTATTGPANGGALIGTITDAVVALGDFALATTSADLTVNPLPVELTAFAARRRITKGISLSWATASEHNSATFEVQRSLDGYEFILVATVQAQGTSTQATVYTALDEAAPASKLYYRLRQLDRDGRVAFSPVVAVAGAGETTKVELYPNPAHSRISFIAKAAMPYRVLNQLGQSLLRGITEAGTASIGLETLPIGLYFLELQTATGRTVQKFEKE